MAARSTRIGGRNPEQAGQAAWLATEKVVRPSTRPERHSAFPAFRSCASSARFASFSSDASRAPCPLSSTPQNAELFTLTYGAIVRQVLHDYEDCVEEANKKLDAMGHSIGCRLVEDFLAKTNVQRCGDFRDVVDAVAKVGLRMFLGVSARAEGWNEDETECRVVLESNPLADFVELPERYRNLSYCQMLCGVVRGALETVGRRCECDFAKDALRGDDRFELRLRHVEMIEDEYPFDD